MRKASIHTEREEPVAKIRLQSLRLESGSLGIASWLSIARECYGRLPPRMFRFDPDREEFTVYDETDGLPASSVDGSLEDRSGNLWVSTAGGLSRFNPRTKTFTNYYEADGLAGNAFEGFPAACQSRAVRCSSAARAGSHHSGRNRLWRSH